MTAYPDWSPEQVEARILDTADNIDGINPFYAGLLGSGRINAYQAVLDEIPPKPTPTPVPSNGFWDVGVFNPNGHRNFYINYGDGKGGFGGQTVWQWLQLPSDANIFTGDFNGDGKWDVGAFNPNGHRNFYINYGDGKGGFGGQTVWQWLQLPSDADIFTGDFNG
jgi:hypothetical protein